MPWLFGQSDRASLDLFRTNWRDSPAGAGRLFAFGLDAYRILPYLARMRHEPNLRIPGSTGVLHMDSGGRVVRDLTMARFVKGVPRLLNE
jgi:outer membrane PBP1 activator LpoA protein